MVDKNDGSDAPARVATAARTAVKAADTNLEALAAHVEEVEGDVANDLGDRVASLREQLAEIAQKIEQLATDRFEQAREFVADAGEAVGRQTMSAARAVRQDPLPTVVTLGVIALLASLVAHRIHER